MTVAESFPAPACACGCGQPVTPSKTARREGRPWNRFIHGHNPQRKPRRPSGEEVPLCLCGCGKAVRWNRIAGRWSRVIGGHPDPEARRKTAEKVRARFVPLSTKCCAGCKEVKPLSDFPRCRLSRSGRRSRCHACEKAAYQAVREQRIAAASAWYAQHKEQRKVYSRNYYAKNKGKWDISTAKRRAAAGAESFTEEEWAALKATYNFTCLRCGDAEPNIALSPDHVVPLSKGGSNTIDNIQPLCWPCNNWKRARTIDYRRGVAP